ncbi:MAG TPA: hypothetical protein VNB49_15515 [Candidatus Dormibacteraeota bacterium]|nr:hypothetical protein [Candidatus Dormibacteraeota bacterium]
MNWARLLAYVTGTVNQELLLRNEYLAAENRILRGQIKGRVLLTEGEKATLAEIAHRLGRRALEDVAATAKPDTILGWYRKLIASKFDGSKWRRRVGRPKISEELCQVENLIFSTGPHQRAHSSSTVFTRASHNAIFVAASSGELCLAKAAR